jgi:hypothetical protein
MKTLNVLSVIVINVLLMSVIFLNFNPNNLNLLELKYFGGFDIFNLFSTDLYGNIAIVMSFLLMVLINVTHILTTINKKRGV